jgi:hypothetical protein
MGPYGAQRTEIALQSAVEGGIEKRRRFADLFLSCRRNSRLARLRACGPRERRRKAKNSDNDHDRNQLSPTCRWFH